MFRKAERLRKAKERAAAKKEKRTGKPQQEMKAHKIRLYPAAGIKKTLRSWLGAARWTYNQCVAVKRERDRASRETRAMVSEDNLDRRSAKGGSSTKSPMSKKVLRASFINEAALSSSNNEWANAIPYDVRDEGMADFLKAVDAQNAKTTWVPSLFKFRRKKCRQESIVIRKKYFLTKKGVYAEVLTKLNPVKKLPKTIESDSRIMRTRLGKYFLVLPTPCVVANDAMEVCGVEGRGDEGSDSQASSSSYQKSSVVSLDPGVRTFMTGYDADGAIFEWGVGDNALLLGLCCRYDDLQKVWTKRAGGAPRKQRVAYKRAGLRIYDRIRNLVDETHKKLSKFLCETYKVIVTSDFSTGSMCRKSSGRCIGSKTARSMYTWAHYRFRQRLLSKAREYPDCSVLIRGEEYTSKTCGNCGHLNYNLGSGKAFSCPTCSCVFDRDANGARNILIKTLTELHPFLC